MQIGKVVGTITATRKEPRLDGFKILIVATMTIDLKPTGSHVIAIDTVGSGFGEVVLLVSGSSARQSNATDKKPVDLAIVGILDSINIIDSFAEFAGLPAGDIYVKSRDDI